MHQQPNLHTVLGRVNFPSKDATKAFFNPIWKTCGRNPPNHLAPAPRAPVERDRRNEAVPCNAAAQPRTRRIVQPSVVRHTDRTLLRAPGARLTFSRMSLAEAVQSQHPGDEAGGKAAGLRTRQAAAVADERDRRETDADAGSHGRSNSPCGRVLNCSGAL